MVARIDTAFTSSGQRCAAWLYLPNDGPAPVIVMAHGLGAVKEMRLDAFAERFTAAGYACLVFDYRHFGASNGQPRQLLDITRQLEDWKAAVAYARTVNGVDPDRVIVWGTSFGGGHAIVTAAQDSRVAAAIAQCPFTDGFASATAMPVSTSIKVTALAVRDRIGALLGREPFMVSTYGPPGSTALMSAPDSEPGMLAITPEGNHIRKDIAARFALQIIRYYPGRYARKVNCPILFVICEPDTVAPEGPTQKYAAQAPRGEVKLYNAGHFDIYVGDDFERNVVDQLAFLRTHVSATTTDQDQH